MSQNSEKLITWLEKMKEVQRIQYDYFKYLITLSTGSILIIIVIMEKVFTNPQPNLMKLVMISLSGFAVAIIFSLGALPDTANLIMYINALQKAEMYRDKKEKEKMQKKYNKKINTALNNIKIFSWGVFCFYTLSIMALLVSVFIYFFIKA